jgi:hypothetical protein
MKKLAKSLKRKWRVTEQLKPTKRQLISTVARYFVPASSISLILRREGYDSSHEQNESEDCNADGFTSPVFVIFVLVCYLFGISYAEAADIYRELGTSFVKKELTKYGAKKAFLKSSLCTLARGVSLSTLCTYTLAENGLICSSLFLFH